MRQYSTFAGIVFGQKTRKFFAKLVERKYASESVDIDGTKLRHVADRGRSGAKGSFAVDNDQTTHLVITGRLWSMNGINGTTPRVNGRE